MYWCRPLRCSGRTLRRKVPSDPFIRVIRRLETEPRGGRTAHTGVNLSSTNAASSIGPRPTPPANAVRPRTPGELIYDGPGHLLKEHKAGVQERRRSEDEARGHSFPLGGIAALDFHSRYGSPRFDFEAVMSVYGHRVNSEPETSSRGRGKRKRKGRTPQKNSRTLPGPRFPIK